MLFVIFFFSLSSLLIARPSSDWKTIAPGMDYKYVIAKKPSAVGDSRIFVLRMDPNLWQLEATGISQTGESTGHTARDWSRGHKFTAAINAGMFAEDYKTHLGYMGSSSYVNNSKQNSYQSVAAFEPRNSQSLPRFRIFDLDAPGVHFENILKDYSSALQNLRLIKHPGSNQWGQQTRKWSEAALGEDAQAISSSSIPARPFPCTISTPNFCPPESASSPPNISKAAPKLSSICTPEILNWNCSVATKRPSAKTTPTPPPGPSPTSSASANARYPLTDSRRSSIPLCRGTIHPAGCRTIRG